ncbi:PP2C family protein-serine/threonine phosphatase [Paenibacillus thalictri]|uniref:Serine/threonine-protein phosphatase n=1 Tax=Paenibacillus thalictri TaxID=2527873 RepID=A0A4V2J4L1_9BACL|nr:PP2C family serine/threonine-protein phosphatase [Paenibacillus thalictri]TBL80251.1 serine/threonine-protein phosphatase [Paenibacillus thalictri]
MKKTVAVNWQYGTFTHSGWYQADNEDRSLLRIGTSEQGDPYAVAIIADGMGGYGSGAEASELALTMTKEWMDHVLPIVFAKENPLDELDHILGLLFHRINEHLVQTGVNNESKLGTTLSILILYKEVYLLHHTGDCRIYYRKQTGRIQQLTEDQTWVAEQVRLKKLSPLQAVKHPNRSVLLHCLGINPQLSVFRKKGYYDPYSLFMLCSDGLYTRFREDELDRLLLIVGRGQLDLPDICSELVNQALSRGANDNLTVMLLRPMTVYSTEKERLVRQLNSFYREKLPETGKKMASDLNEWVRKWRK